MENYKIILPIENEGEEKKIKEVAKPFDGIETSIGTTRNIDGFYDVEFLGTFKDIIEFSGALASIYAAFSHKRVKIIGTNGLLKSNIKLGDISNFFKNLNK